MNWSSKSQRLQTDNLCPELWSVLVLSWPSAHSQTHSHFIFSPLTFNLEHKHSLSDVWISNIVEYCLNMSHWIFPSKLPRKREVLYSNHTLTLISRHHVAIVLCEGRRKSCPNNRGRHKSKGDTVLFSSPCFTFKQLYKHGTNQPMFLLSSKDEQMDWNETTHQNLFCPVLLEWFR